MVKFSIYLNRRVFTMHPISAGLRITRFFKISEKGSVTSRKLKNKICTITKTCLYKFYPLKPHFYIVKLGFTGVYIIFLISAQKYRLWCSLEPPRRGGSNEYPQSMFWAEILKILEFFYLEIFNFWMKKFSVYLNRRFLVMCGEVRGDL